MSAEKKSPDGSRVVFYALSMAFGTLLSRILGLVRDMAFAALFSRTVTDAWTTAFRLPNLFRRLLGEGSLSVSFIPIFVECRTQESADNRLRSQNLVNSFYLLLLGVLSILTVLGIVFTEPIINLLLSENYSVVPGKLELTVRMARIMFGFIFLMSSYAYFMGILNALGSFALPAMAPTFFNIAMIISTLVPIDWLASPGDALAWGVIAGGAIQAGILIPSLIRYGYLPRLSFKNLTNPDALRVIRNMIPGLFGTGLLQITTIVNLHFASSLGEGPISYIYLADRLLELPLSLIAVSLGTALLPSLAQLWANGEKLKMQETINYYLRINLFVAIPAAVGLFFLALPIVEALFLRGKFSAVEAEVTASIVRIYAFTLLSASLVRVLVPSFYAIKNTWLPALISGVCLLFHLALAPWLMSQFALQGLIASSFFSSLLNFLLLMISFRIFIGSLEVVKILQKLFWFAIPAAGLGIAIQTYKPLYQFVGEGSLGRVLALALSIFLGMLTYGLISHWLKLEEFSDSFSTIVKKLSNKLKKSAN